MWGKSIMGLALAHAMQMRTLIVTTTTVIRDMWEKEIKKFFGFDPGVIGAGKFINQEAPIVVGNIQTVKKMAQKLSSDFGVLIIDECHHCPATTFSDVLFTSRAAVKIGLSGTHIRKDGKHVLFKDFFGTKVFVGEDTNRMTPEVYSWETNAELSGNQLIPWALRVNKLFEQQEYYEDIFFITACLETMGHKVLIVADRVAFLEALHESIPSSVMIAGDTNKTTEEREEAMALIKTGQKKVILATQSIFSEGVSLNELSAVVLATPINNDSLLEQIIGRVQRKADSKILDPVVVDITLQGNTGKRQALNRRAFYSRQGWKYTPISRASLIVRSNNARSK